MVINSLFDTISLNLSTLVDLTWLISIWSANVGGYEKIFRAYFNTIAKILLYPRDITEIKPRGTKVRKQLPQRGSWNVQSRFRFSKRFFSLVFARFFTDTCICNLLHLNKLNFYYLFLFKSLYTKISKGGLNALIFWLVTPFQSFFNIFLIGLLLFHTYMSLL